MSVLLAVAVTVGAVLAATTQIIPIVTLAATVPSTDCNNDASSIVIILSVAQVNKSVVSTVDN